MDTYIFYGAAITLLILSAVKSREKTLLAMKKAWKAFENILPQFLVVVVLIGVLLSILDPEQISRIIGKDSGAFGVVLAALIGSVTLIPPFVAFPTAALLLEGGAGTMQIAAFVSTLMMVGVITLPVEARYFGRKTAIGRNLLALAFSFLVAILMGMVVK